ncbi:MAG: acyl--CoA ligase [Microbispora sp.]|nr:acyl--CoA ligase [Microbispora sp.]
MPLERLPAEIEERTVRALLDARAAEAPDRTALIGQSLCHGGERSLTYADLRDESLRLASILAELGVAKGDRVAIMLSNAGAVEAHLGYHAAHRLGAISVPTSDLYVARELAYVLRFATPKVLLCADTELLRAPEVAEALEDTAVLRCDAALGQRLAAEPPAPPSVPELDEDDDADWIFTSGTTGFPKAVALTHGNSVACGHQSRSLWDLDGTSVYQSSAPFFTSTGCHTNLLGALAAGCTYVVEPAFDAQQTLERVARYKTTSIFLISGAVRLILDRIGPERLGEMDLRTLRRLTYGGQSMSPSFYKAVDAVFRDRLGIELAHLYGLTEGGTSGVVLPPELHEQAVRRCEKRGMTVGCQGFNEWIRFRVVDDEDREAPPGTVGEICFRGPAVMRGYVGEEGATAEALRGGWLHTGDLGRTDEEGFLYFVDRKKQMIRRGGLNIASAEVEAVLLEHPAVAEAAAVPKPNPVLGEEVRAVVVLNPGAAASAEELIEHCAKWLARYKVPVEVEFRDELPKNSMGRVVKSLLTSAPGQAMRPAS